MTHHHKNWLRIHLNDSAAQLQIAPTFSGCVIEKTEAAVGDPAGILHHLTDQLVPLYNESTFHHGFVVLPQGIVDDLTALKNPNIMLSIPASENGLQIGRELLFSGVSVCFVAYSLSHYEKAMKLYLRAIEDRDIHYRPLAHVRSVVSFDVGVIDAAVKAQLSNQHNGSDLDNRAGAALVQLARQKFDRYFSGDSWMWLAEHGAQPQSIMVDLSSVSDPQYYVDELADYAHLFSLMAHQNVDHNRPENIFQPELTASAEAGYVLRDLGALGLHLDELGEELVQSVHA